MTNPIKTTTAVSDVAGRLNERISVALILERQILDVLSAARIDSYMGLRVLRAVSAIVRTVRAGEHI